MKKKVCIVMPVFFKYPNFNGCAVETLISIIGKKNKKYGDIELTIVTKKNKNDGVIKINLFDNFLFFIYRVVKKIFKYKINCFERYSYKVKKFIEKNNFDYIIYEAGDVEDFSYIVRKIKKNKLIYHIHHDLYIESSKTQEIINDTFGYYLSVSNFCSSRFIDKFKVGEERIYLLRNVTTNENYKQITIDQKQLLRKKLGFNNDDFVVIFAGRLIEVKGIKQLIDAMKNIKYKNIKLLILGSSFSENSKETKFIKSLKEDVLELKDRVVFSGYILHSDIFKYYQIADLGVIPSICEEAAGLVGIEQMICGLPIICTKSGGMNEYLTAHNSIQVDKSDLNKLSYNLEKNIIDVYEKKINVELLKNNALRDSKLYSEDNYYKDFVNAINYFSKEEKIRCNNLQLYIKRR
jgi:spore coat protein SA